MHGTWGFPATSPPRRLPGSDRGLPDRGHVARLLEGIVSK